MQRDDEVLIKRGAWRGTRAMIVRVIDPGYGGGMRVELTPNAAVGERINLAASSVELLTR